MWFVIYVSFFPSTKLCTWFDNEITQITQHLRECKACWTHDGYFWQNCWKFTSQTSKVTTCQYIYKYVLPTTHKGGGTMSLLYEIMWAIRRRDMQRHFQRLCHALSAAFSDKSTNWKMRSTKACDAGALIRSRATRARQWLHNASAVSKLGPKRLR